jgi:hypothetical protein
MSRRRFSPQQLRYLRNQIPIASVIPSINRDDGNRPRFDCPLCGGRDTAINKSTNLARCFGCKKNFNPIEMVMAARRLSFVDAVNLLLEQCHKPKKTPADHKPINAKRLLVPPCSENPNQSKPTEFKDIIPSVIGTLYKPQYPEKYCDGCKRLEKSLADIQQRLSQIERLIADLNLPEAK